MRRTPNARPTHRRSPRDRRIAIVGAGPGGLAAAMLLARAGADVTMFERLDRVGGRTGTIVGDSPAGGFRFDMGPTFFLYPRVLADIFAHCDADLAEHVELIRLDPLYDLIFEAGGRLRVADDLARLGAEIAKLSPADAANLPRYMNESREKLRRFRPVFEQEFESLLDWLTPGMIRALPLMRPLHTVDSDLARHFADPRVRLAFSFQTKYLGMAPYRCPSLFTILAFMEHEFGVWHPVGGCGAVMAAMARVARQMGVAIHLDEGVDRLIFEGKRAVGVATARGEQRFDAVVVNADFDHAMHKLVPNHLRRRWTDEKLAAKKFSCSTYMLYLGIEGRAEDLGHHTIFLTEDYRRNIAEIEAGGEVTSPSFYVQNAGVTDETLAPRGHSTLYALFPVGNLHRPGVDWTTLRGKFRRRALDRLAQLGLPDLERRIVFEKELTPIGWRDDMAIGHGATFNLAHTLGQMLHWRPRNRFEDLERVYLVGGGTHPGSGLPVIFESARITARLMADDLGLVGAAALPDARPTPAGVCMPAEVL